MTEPRILVMAKAPVPGSVKTRLRLPPEEAARLQEAMICDAVEKAASVAPVTVAASPAAELDSVRKLIPADAPLLAQPEGDLGHRMLAGASELFDRGGAPVLVIGTDAPTLPASYLRDALVSLETESDAALTPSEDGGYVMIGLRKPYATLFEGISWSTPQVYGQTVETARRAGFRVYETGLWYDVDVPEDLERLRAELARDPALAPHTAGLLG